MQTPSVNRWVHYYDREEFVSAKQQKREPEPFPALISRVHRDQTDRTVVLADVATLHVFDPEVGGARVVHDCRRASEPAPNTWMWPPFVPPPVPVAPTPPTPPANRIAAALAGAAK